MGMIDSLPVQFRPLKNWVEDHDCKVCITVSVRTAENVSHPARPSNASRVEGTVIKVDVCECGYHKGFTTMQHINLYCWKVGWGNYEYKP